MVFRKSFQLFVSLLNFLIDFRGFWQKLFPWEWYLYLVLTVFVRGGGGGEELNLAYFIDQNGSRTYPNWLSIV